MASILLIDWANYLPGFVFPHEIPPVDPQDPGGAQPFFLYEMYHMGEVISGMEAQQVEEQECYLTAHGGRGGLG